MNCPKCSHDVKKHSILGCSIDDCACNLTALPCCRAAQRHAAAVRLDAFRRAIHGAMQAFMNGMNATTLPDLRMRLKAYQMALRDTGVQRKRKSDR